LIEATAGDRYNAISRFIDVSGVESSEAALRELIKALSARRGEAVAVVDANQQTIQQFWESASKPGASSLSWAAIEAKRDPNASDAEVAALNALQIAYARLSEYPARLKLATDAVTNAKGTAAAAQVKAQECVQIIAADAGEVMSVLESARSYLLKHPSTTACPLCESTEKVSGLSQRITARLTSFSALQAAQAQTKSAETGVKRAEQAVDSLREMAQKHSTAFESSRGSFSWSGGACMDTSFSHQLSVRRGRAELRSCRDDIPAVTCEDYR
jgi:predicted DCC family thiol-disulfide oxidoreductase YuxK